MSPTHSTAVIRSISATAMPIFDGLFLACGSSAVAVAPTRVMSLRSARPASSRETHSPVDANANLASNSSDVPAAYRAQEMGSQATPEQVKELQKARQAFEEARPYGSHDAEAAYKQTPELAREAAGGQVSRAVRAFQLETELRTDPCRGADRFVER